MAYIDLIGGSARQAGRPMCGKFTAMASWRKVADFANLICPFAGDASVTYWPMTMLPVIVFDFAADVRRVVPMRWGFPRRSDPAWSDPIHAPAETIDERPAFRDAFLDGLRGIVVMQTFNEAREIGNKTEQWTIDPGDDVPRGVAFLWRRFETGTPTPLFACVMVNVPASALIGPITGRMPAILEPRDWSTWLGESDVSPAAAKTCLRTVEDARWTMTPEADPSAEASRQAGLF